MNFIAIKENVHNENQFEVSKQMSIMNSSSLFSDTKLVLTNVFGTIKKESPVLFWISMFCLFLAVACMPGLILDDRIIMGISVWLKPLKFSISTAIYILSLGYFITFYPYSKRKKWVINGIVSWTLLLELVIIVYQGAVGVQSHYNMSSPIDGMMFAAMGVLIGINVFIMVLFVFDTIRLKLNTEKSIQWSILLSWVVVIAGSWIGGQMISQMSHTVGAADGGEGIAFLNWSTIAGDLRIAHFFALHGLQIIPLFAVVLFKKWNSSMRNQIIAVTIFALLYAGWIGFTFFQAKQGLALINL